MKSLIIIYNMISVVIFRGYLENYFLFPVIMFEVASSLKYGAASNPV
jgi:hypothetical protein